MRWWKTSRVVVLWSFHLFSLISKVTCTGIFELELTKFQNINGLNDSGNCCNGFRIGTKCSLPCRTFFRICLTNYQAEITEDIHCNFAEEITPILGDNNVDFRNISSVVFENPVQFPFLFTWPGTFSLILEAWHDSTDDGPSQDSARQLISWLGVQKTLQVGESWQQFTHTTGHTELGYSYRVICDEYYYGPGCSNLCKPRNDQFGHYDCDDNGTKVCLDGWEGPYCDQAVCLAGCHPDHGFCDKPNECTCRLGFQGVFCNECLPYPGCLHGTCSAPFECNCEEGWGGLFCNQDLNYCTHYSPCQNGGICTNTGQGSYTCNCPNGFQGTNCEIEVNDCEMQPCSNGGTCVTVGSSFECKCPDGYTGKRCDTLAVSCTTNPCKNNATCMEVDGMYQCHCRGGFTGYNCDIEINECVSNPCQNRGGCVDQMDGFQCVCVPGYSGQFCEENIDDCSDNPCLNGGTCFDEENAFSCRCVPGFVGPLCQLNVPDCETRPCANGGVCHDLVNDFSCTCAPGWEGKDCRYNTDDCRSNPCKHGGVCHDLVNDYRCECTPGYFGKDCSGPDTTKSPMQNRTTINPINVTSRTSASQESEITKVQLVLIVCLGAGIPLLLIIGIVIFFLLRKRNTHQLTLDTRKEEDQNVKNNFNNKLAESKIFTTNQTAQSGPRTSSNVKLTNEEQNDFNTYMKPGGVNYVDKASNKILINTKDLNKQHEQFSRSPPPKDIEKFAKIYNPDSSDEGLGHSVNDSSYNNSSIHIIAKSKAFQRDADRNSTVYLEPPSVHRHSYYSDDVLATEV